MPPLARERETKLGFAELIELLMLRSRHPNQTSSEQLPLADPQHQQLLLPTTLDNLTSTREQMSRMIEVELGIARW